MSLTSFAILQCTNQACRLRVPATGGQRMDRCPRCHAPAELVESCVLDQWEGSTKPAARLPLALLLDNVRSAFNVGSMLRSADGAGVAHVYLCGFTPTPAHPRVAKTSLGAEAAVGWSQHLNALDLVQECRAQGAVIWALERTPGAVSLWDLPLPRALDAASPLVLVAGSEVAGVDPGLLRTADAVVALPMRGRKLSLNVAIAAGVALSVLGERMVRELPLADSANADNEKGSHNANA